MADETEVTASDTSADTEIQAAESEGTEEEVSTGAETQEDQAAESDDGDTDTTGEAAEGGTEENKDKGAHQKTLEERVTELAEKRIAEAEAKLAKMEAMLSERLGDEPPDFLEVDVHAMNAHMNELLDQAEDLRLEGKRVEAFEIEEYVRNLKREFSENEAKKKAWLERNQRKQTEQQQGEAYRAQMNKAIAEATPIVRQGMNITEEAWNTGEKFFVERRKADPLLNKEYLERVERDGPVRALKWAAEYCQRELSKNAEAAKKKKEEGKQNQIGGSTESATKGFETVKSWNDLMKLHSKDINRFSKENPKKFTELKNRHFNK